MIHLSHQVIYGLSFITMFCIFLSLFDVYFHSPILEGLSLTNASWNLRPLAKRIVFISVDGLRADTLYDEPNLAPFIQSRAVLGIRATSLAALPTESRPGHVALMAGVPEDPSAVTRGWTVNPVGFDTLINRSQLTIALGSPDIVPMLTSGLKRARAVYQRTYSAQMQNFADTRPWRLDNWVFDHMHRLLSCASFRQYIGATQQPLSSESAHLLLFLHLLGTDTAGHGHRPASREYKQCVRNIDGRVRALVRRLHSRVWRDPHTAYLLTSDHGMTAWGAHGTGLRAETHTPLVLWGAGVAGAHCPHTQGPLPTFRHVRQTDIAALVSVLLGQPIPAHSIGVVPAWMLCAPEQYRARVLHANMLQLRAQFLLRRRLAAAKRVFGGAVEDFPPLAPAVSAALLSRAHRALYLQPANYTLAQSVCRQLMELYISGSRHYFTHGRPFLQACVALTHLGLLALLACCLHCGHLQIRAVKWLCVALLLILAVACFLFADVRVIYVLYPSTLWVLVLASGRLSAISVRSILSTTINWSKLLLIFIVFELVVWSIMYRWLITPLLFILFTSFLSEHSIQFTNLSSSYDIRSLFIDYHSHSLDRPPIGQQTYTSLCAKFFLVSSLIAVFPLIPTVTHESNPTVVTFAVVLTFLLNCRRYFRCRHSSNRPAAQLISPPTATSYSTSGCCPACCRVSRLFVPLLALVACLTHSSGAHTAHILVLARAWLAWSLIPLSFLLCCWCPHRLDHLAQAASVCSFLLSVSYESLFVPLLSLHLHTWSQLEQRRRMRLASQSHGSSTAFELCRFALITLFYYIVAFFGVGNLDSLNSFNTSAIRLFVTVFSPYTMAALLLFRTVLPFLLVACYTRHTALCVQHSAADDVPVLVSHVHTSSRARVSSSHSRNVSLLAFCVAFSAHYFFLVTDAGAWKDIGFSISRYVISACISLIGLVLDQLASVILNNSYVSQCTASVTKFD